MAGSLILNVFYGIEPQSLQDPLMATIQKGWDIMSAATNPGLFLVDTISACTPGYSDTYCFFSGTFSQKHAGMDAWHGVQENCKRVRQDR